ncbi:hypothetical protein GJ744_004928 [Endocarpon pusillum]|uniref:RNase MRP protein 1 RNA binding domain-containing protein n=1 Tax=Endocarpon pusillum TaxID=364733 RepID=A0A8H7E7S6_9EURO|nr:hypothetical protein GJ744_004928 [Endocarpon pusillum]
MPPHKDRKMSRSMLDTRTLAESDPTPRNSELREVDHQLHLIYRRNKNQHRLQKWWKWVGLLRRSIKKLLAFEGRGWIRREEEKEKEHLERWVREVLIPGAWLAFSTLVADTQFSTLGVVLTAVLARVGKILGLPKTEQQALGMEIKLKSLLAASVRQTGQDAGEIVLREYVEDMGNLVERRKIGEESRATDGFTQTGKEVKELILNNKADRPRDSEVGKGVPKVNMVQGTTVGQGVQSVKSQARPRKKCKKGNTIDDLFSDLV